MRLEQKIVEYYWRNTITPNESLTQQEWQRCSWKEHQADVPAYGRHSSQSLRQLRLILNALKMTSSQDTKTSHISSHIMPHWCYWYCYSREIITTFRPALGISLESPSSTNSNQLWNSALSVICSSEAYWFFDGFPTHHFCTVLCSYYRSWTLDPEKPNV